MHHNLLSVIICTYNTRDLTLQCLGNLHNSILLLNSSVEIILVENGTDGTADLVKKKYPLVKIISPGENTGYSKGNNLGLAAADKNSKYLLLLNSDALIKPETLKKSISFMENHPDSDVFGCRLEFSDGHLQPSAGFLPRPVPVWMWMWGLDLLPVICSFFQPVHPRNPQYFSATKRVEWVMGAYLFARHEVFQKARGFDPNFFMYLEEVDLCKRINDLGLKIWYTPEFSITHLDKASAGGDIRNAIVKEAQGLIYYIRKYYPGSVFWILPTVKIGLLGRQIIYGLLGNKYKQDIYREAYSSI